MINYQYTDNFSNSLHQLFLKYNNKKTNIILSGGSILPLFQNEEISKLNTKQWKIYLSDERITDKEEEKNINDLKLYLKNLDCQINELNITTKIPEIDLAILSVGEDGHVASLFPSHNLLSSNDEIVEIEDSPKLPRKRVSIGVKVLNRCHNLVFMLPPKNGVVKKVTRPHESITSLLIHNFDVYLDSSLKPIE